MPRILVIEDDLATAQQLRGSGHEVELAQDGLAGLALASNNPFDAMTLDRMLPGLDGLALVAALRERSIDVPVLMISALSDVDERIAGIRAGGDDYLVKPFSPQEMVARVEALIRRSGATAPDAVIRSGGIEMNLMRRSVQIEGKLLRKLDQPGQPARIATIKGEGYRLEVF